MASDPAVELARKLRSRIWCRACLGAVPSVDVCPVCGGTGCTPSSIETIRAAIDAARAEERETCAATCELVPVDTIEAIQAVRDCAAAIRGRG